MDMGEDATRHGAHGVWEDIKGRLKSAVGALTNRRDLDREGRAQQDKAEAERDAAARETEAARARAEAEVHEARQRGAQRDQ
jgi:uncharacterized protein YjbJ (UPF0337 family)